MDDNTLVVVPLDPRFSVDMLGFLPSFLEAGDTRPVKEQFNERYAHGGGWRPFKGFTRSGDTLTYPGDPPMHPLAVIVFRDEWIYLYPHDWVRVDDEVCRMD